MIIINENDTVILMIKLLIKMNEWITRMNAWKKKNK